MTKLNLASGTDIRPREEGWLNLDVVQCWPGAVRGADVRWDACRDPLPFWDNSIEEIYAGYLLLHLPYQHHRGVLTEIRRVLAPGAACLFGEVDMGVVMHRWLEYPTSALAELIWGEQGTIHGDEFSRFDKHCHGFTEASLRKALLDANFVEVERVKIHVDAVFYELTLRCTKR